MKQVFAPHRLAMELMDNLFDLYACAVLNTDADLDDETFETIEGNTAIGNDSNGGKVMIRRRSKKTAIFVHP